MIAQNFPLMVAFESEIPYTLILKVNLFFNSNSEQKQKYFWLIICPNLFLEKLMRKTLITFPIASFFEALGTRRKTWSLTDHLKHRIDQKPLNRDGSETHAKHYTKQFFLPSGSYCSRSKSIENNNSTNKSLLRNFKFCTMNDY
ncbi:hypothetical protein BpHYR1_001731 [Brachionus plicatilis]|uniref:Uncharacterized protein n=1 Tax=Brachionus plicatilis TaxID=10195 RepID=A0A3M7QPJ0_BRAPC|nr:hypothetical protein BpHYR1_001731 [Brachionus plicatilis]